MGTVSDFTDDRDEQPPQRRDRLGAASPSWPPDAANPSSSPSGHARFITSPTEAGRPPPPRDRLTDTGPAGLHTFDLGTVPASVTLPHTWRRAAWFAVVASVAALVALVLVTSFLVSPMHVASRINALPSLPDGVPPNTAPTPGPSDQPDNLAAETSAVARGGPGVAAPAGSGAWNEVGSGDPPTVRTVSGVGPIAVDPTRLAELTRQFFAEVVSDVAGAAALTVNSVRDTAAMIIQDKYRGVSSMQVKSISLDPRTGVTVSVLQVVNKDGTSILEQQTLHFTLTGDPKIQNPAG